MSSDESARVVDAAERFERAKPKRRRAKKGTAAAYNRGTAQRPNWWIRFTVNGKQVREPVKGARLKSQAEALLAKRKKEAFEGTYFPQKRTGSLTLEKLRDTWLEAKKRKASIASDKVRWEKLIDLLGATTPIASLTHERIAKLVGELEDTETRFGKKMKPASVNRHLEVLRAALRLPDAKKCLVHDPFDGVAFLPELNERDRECSPAEYKKLIEAASPNLRLAILIAYHTGMRDGEITELRLALDGEHGWVDLKAKAVRLPSPATKTKKDRIVPLSKEIIAEIKKAPKHSSGRIIPIESTTVSSLFTRLCRSCEIEDLHFHDLRHTALSRFRRAGIDVFTIAAISGHRDLASLRRYQTHTIEDLHAAIAKVKL